MDLVKLWRNTPVTAIKGNDVDISRDVIISSARQGLTKAIAILGLKRSDYVGMPDYVGHCIIDFIGRKATPVPIKFLPQKHTSAVLLYDQWGWQKTSIARLELKKKYQNISKLTTDVDDYIEFYNHQRFHETLDYKKPMDVYQESIKLNQNKKKAS